MKKFFVFLIVASCTRFVAQSDVLQFKRTLEFEVDPIAYLMKGYSFHGIYNHNHLRFDLGYYGIETPGKLTGNPGYNVRNTGFGLKVNYLITKVNGLYAGIDAGYGETVATVAGTELRDTGHNISAGVHAGYRLFLFPHQENWLSGLYLTPWAGLSYNHTYDNVKLDSYKTSKVGYFATFHMGYRF